MKVFASIAHRGSLSFLPKLYENTVYALSPSWTCIFTSRKFEWANTTVFVERDVRKRHGTMDVVRRYMQCYAHIYSNRLHSSLDDVLVFVAANQRFFRPCAIEPHSYSFTPIQLTVSNNIVNPYGRPIDYPSLEWSKMMSHYVSSYPRYQHQYDSYSLFAQFLMQYDIKGWKHSPNAVTQSEGSFYTVRQLTAMMPAYETLRNVSLRDVRFSHTFPECWVLATKLVQSTSVYDIAVNARPPLCFRSYDAIPTNRSEYMTTLRARYNKFYCCVKVPGAEHVFGS